MRRPTKRLRETSPWAIVIGAPGRPAHQLFEFRCEPQVSFFVVRPVAENDVAFAVERHAILGIRQVLRREPESSESIAMMSSVKPVAIPGALR